LDSTDNCYYKFSTTDQIAPYELKEDNQKYMQVYVSEIKGMKGFISSAPDEKNIETSDAIYPNT